MRDAAVEAGSETQRLGINVAKDFDRSHTVRPASTQHQRGAGKIEKTRIDGQLLGAKMFTCIGIVPVVFYWFAFRAFGSSGFPWMCALAIEIFCPIFAYMHYFLNRRAKRLVWAGASVCIGFFSRVVIAGIVLAVLFLLGADAFYDSRSCASCMLRCGDRMGVADVAYLRP
ncbi:hypothetical protein [Burkholderia ubonensis]|uniref:hypothetical protein n=1 Tax=Burkholderia ubonensis TaxID=101571 RepID=UPI000AD8DEF3|nr:hypothetical protein [Burkholderia ubonensis]